MNISPNLQLYFQLSTCNLVVCCLQTVAKSKKAFIIIQGQKQGQVHHEWANEIYDPSLSFIYMIYEFTDVVLLDLFICRVLFMFIISPDFQNF